MKTKRVLIYGPPKTGKSLIAGKLAETKKLIWLDFENGYDVLYQLPQEWQERIQIIAVPDTKAVPMAIETALKVIRGSECKICHKHGKVMPCQLCVSAKEDMNYDRVCLNELNGNTDTVVVWDSATQLMNSAIANITRKESDEYKMERDDWANLGKIMDIFLTGIQAARFNNIVISHEMPVEMNDGKEKLVPVAGTRNFSRNAAKYFSDVVYCNLENKQHKFWSATTALNNVVTGSRSNIKIEDMKNEVKLSELFK